MSVEDEVRKLVRDSPESRYAISLSTEIPESQLSRFLNGQSLRTGTLEQLAHHFGYDIALKRRKRS